MIDSRTQTNGADATVLYNDFHDDYARPVQGGGLNNTWPYNVFRNWCVACSNSGAHGEVVEFEAAIGTIAPTVDFSFNTAIVGATAADNCCTATFLPSRCSTPITTARPARGRSTTTDHHQSYRRQAAELLVRDYGNGQSDNRLNSGVR